jgi:hypothetical protein
MKAADNPERVEYDTFMKNSTPPGYGSYISWLENIVSRRRWEIMPVASFC